MSRVYHNKLVRDGIKEKIEAKGEECDVHEITDNIEFRQALLQKAVEEATELSRTTSRDEFLFEYADLMIVLDALTELDGYSEADIRVALEENIAKKGKYKKRHFLEWTETK